MDVTATLLKCLKREGIIDNVEKAKDAVQVKKITLRKEDDLFIRDAITGLGTILKEDLDNHFYITSVRMGGFGNILTYGIICRDGKDAEISVYAREGLIKQHLAEKTIQKLENLLC